MFARCIEIIDLSYFTLFQTMTKTVVGDENTPDNFLHPKVCYKLPSHVRTVCNLYIKNLKYLNLNI